MAAVPDVYAATSYLDVIHEDTLTLIASFLDFESAESLSECQECLNSQTHVWKSFFEQGRYAPPSLLMDQNYKQETRYRRKLAFAIERKQSFSLPLRCFSFLPVLPSALLEDDDDDSLLLEDPPPIEWDCDSFALVGPTGPEFVLLHPFDMSLCVYDSVLQDALRGEYDSTEDESSSFSLQATPPKRVLVSPQDVWNIDVSKYFVEDVQVEVANMGITVKRCNPHSTAAFVCCCLGRLFHAVDTDDCVIQVITWGEEEEKKRRSCQVRIPYDEIGVMDVDVETNRLFLCRGQSHIGIYPLLENNDNDDSLTQALWTLAIPNATALATAMDHFLLVASQQRIQLWRTANSSSSSTPPVLVETLVLATETPVDSIHVCEHLPLEKGGFVTLQYGANVGSTISVWSAESDAKEPSSFEVQSIIHLPLSARRRPQVYYDGRRIIVFGQDHIGFILLVYEVNVDSVGNEESGGVQNLSTTKRGVRFVNRIRHVALGGMCAMDSIHMTCNERFIILNTKQGNLLAGNVADGLLIIDLEAV